MFNITPLAVRATIPEVPLQVICRCTSRSRIYTSVVITPRSWGVCRCVFCGCEVHICRYKSTFLERCISMFLWLQSTLLWVQNMHVRRALLLHVFVVAKCTFVGTKCTFVERCSCMFLLLQSTSFWVQNMHVRRAVQLRGYCGCKIHICGYKCAFLGLCSHKC